MKLKEIKKETKLQGKNPSRRYNYCNFICDKHWYMRFHKPNTIGHKGIDR
jgi:hypothetical protein